MNTLAAIGAAKATFRSLHDAWADTTTPHGRLILTVLGGLAEFERHLIAEAAILDRTLISIVDDDELFRESMRKLVMLLDYTVESISGGKRQSTREHLVEGDAERVEVAAGID